MISGFVGPWEPVFMDLSIPKCFMKSKNRWARFRKTQLVKYQILGPPMFYRLWKRRAPKNDEDPLNTILNIFDMGSISTKTREMKILFESTKP